MSAYCSWSLVLTGKNREEDLPKILEVLYRIEGVPAVRGTKIFEVRKNTSYYSNRAEISVFTSNAVAKHIFGENYLEPEIDLPISIANAAPGASWIMKSKCSSESGGEGCCSYMEATYADGDLEFKTELYVDEEELIWFVEDMNTDEDSYEAFCNYYSVDESITEDVYEKNKAGEACDDFFFNPRTNRISLHHTWDVVKCRPILGSNESAPSNAGSLRDGTVRVMTDEDTIQALITAKPAQDNIRRVKMVIDFINLPMKVLVLPSAPPEGIRFEVFYREASMARRGAAVISWNPSNGALFSDATATGDISDRVKEFVCASYYYILNCLDSDENLWDYVTPERERDLEHLLILADENGITAEIVYGEDRPDVLSINASGVDCYVRPCPNEAALLQKSGGTKAKASSKNKNTPNRHVEQNKPEKTLTQRILSESLLLALDDYDISGVKVMCEETVCDEVSQFFFSNFAAGWMAAVQMAEEEYGECESVDIPVKIVKKDYGFLISVGHLEVRYCYGDFYDEEHSFKAFEKALKKMKEAYPESEYEGYIDYFLSDRRGGEALRWELASTRSPEAYDFVGEGLGQILADEKFENSVFWSILSEALECNRKECEETIKVLYTYAKWIRKADLDRIVKAILNLAEEDGENNAGPLAELVERLEAGEAEGGSNEDALLQREKGLKKTTTL